MPTTSSYQEFRRNAVRTAGTRYQWKHADASWDGRAAYVPSTIRSGAATIFTNPADTSFKQCLHNEDTDGLHGDCG